MSDRKPNPMTTSATPPPNEGKGEDNTTNINQVLSAVNLDNPSADDLRLIDAAVAEHVFGVPIAWRNHVPMQADSDEGDGPTDEIHCHSSTNSRVFEIVEAMAERGWMVAIVSTSGAKPHYSIHIVCRDKPMSNCASASPALAVCIAALRARGLIE